MTSAPGPPESTEPHWLPAAGDEPRLRWLWWAAGIVFVLGLVAFLIRGADRPADPVVESGRDPLPGFGEVSVRITAPGGSVLERCLLLAETAEQRARGLMTVTDPELGGYDGMIFRFENDGEGAFWMRNTPMPLTVAYIDAAGTLVSASDMQPCEDRPDCPNYPPAGPYRYAVEVPQGRLAEFGMTEGATLTVGDDSCAPT